MSYNCESLFLTYNPPIWWEIPGILNKTHTNLTDQEILNQLGITDFCSKQHVKETFTFHHNASANWVKDSICPWRSRLKVFCIV